MEIATYGTGCYIGGQHTLFRADSADWMNRHADLYRTSIASLANYVDYNTCILCGRVYDFQDTGPGPLKV